MALAETYPLPEEPTLAALSQALNDAGHWAWVYDKDMRLLFTTDEVRRSHGGGQGLASMPIGMLMYSTEAGEVIKSLPSPIYSEVAARDHFAKQFSYWLDSAGSRESLRAVVDPLVSDLVDSLPEVGVSSASSVQWGAQEEWGINLGTWSTMFDVRDTSGHLVGRVQLLKPAVGMSTIGMIASVGDVRHLERAQKVAKADRRPGAILFADLEASTRLSRRMSTSDYFALSRRLVRAADQCVVDAGGLVGRHLGDGVTAFFLIEHLGSESAAARAAITAARNLRFASTEIATRSGLEGGDMILRFGLHWGATLYVGLFKSVARSEVTAMGDEVNEAARIEACAVGGRALASKALIERLDHDDVRELDLERVTYTLLGELDAATDKTRRDAASIAVCDV